MASVRIRTRKDDSLYYAVLYRHDGKQTSTSFHDHASAAKFAKLVDKVGPARALEATAANTTPDSMTVSEWLEHHTSHLTGVAKSTLNGYRIYTEDINSRIGALPLEAVTRDDVAKLIQSLADKGMAGKTISNRIIFLSGCFSAAVRVGRVPSNPASGHRLPRTEKRKMMCLSREEFARLLDAVAPPWRPLVEFLVASGCRWGEASALKPGDVNLTNNTVHVARAWTRTHEPGARFAIGPTKSDGSVRTINVPRSTLDKLDYSGDWLFKRRDGRAVSHNYFHSAVWTPAVEKAWPSSVDADGKERTPKRPRIHDLRHTSASWLVLAGIPLPVVQGHLGHGSLAITSRYLHVDRTSQAAAAAAMDAILSSDM